jgi:hypothetical protein
VKQKRSPTKQISNRMHTQQGEPAQKLAKKELKQPKK